MHKSEIYVILKQKGGFMKKFLILLFTFILFALPVNAAKWVQLNDDTFIDLESIKNYSQYSYPNSEQKIFWIKQNLENSESAKTTKEELNKNLKYGLTQIIIDTNKKILAIKSYVHYDENNERIAGGSLEHFELMWVDIAPETFGDMLYDVITHERQLKKLYKQQQKNK